jgi:hypothetical protein
MNKSETNQLHSFAYFCVISIGRYQQESSWVRQIFTQLPPAPTDGVRPSIPPAGRMKSTSGHLEDAVAFVLMTPFGLQSIGHDAPAHHSLAVMVHSNFSLPPTAVRIGPQPFCHGRSSWPQFALYGHTIHLINNNTKPNKY